MNPKLAALIDAGELDLDDEKQREMYLKAWTAGNFSPVPPEVPCGPVRRDS